MRRRWTIWIGGLGLGAALLAGCGPQKRETLPSQDEIAPIESTAIAPAPPRYVAGDILVQQRLGAATAPENPALTQMMQQASVTPLPSGATLIQLNGPAMRAFASQNEGRAHYVIDAVEGAPMDPAMAEQMRAQTPIVAEMDAAMKVLRESGRFDWVERNWVVTPQQDQSTRPRDPLYPRQWNFFPNGEGPGRSPGGAGFESYWRGGARAGDASVVVAVIDTGIEAGHPDIVGSGNLLAGYDAISDAWTANDNDGRDGDATDPGDNVARDDPRRPGACPPQREASFHGTHVAGTIGVGGSNNETGVSGGAWRVSVVPVRALGRCGGSSADIADAILWAANAHDPRFGMPPNPRPAAVINMSLGARVACARTPILQDAINRARAAGAVIVAAAGNESADAAGATPAGCTGVITVAAGDARGVLAPYSNFGPRVDLMAPGGDLMRDDARDGFPDGILSTRSSACAAQDGARAECRYSYFQGTSMAAPHVAAAAALLIAHEPTIKTAPIAQRGDLILAWIKRNGAPRSAAQCPRACGGVLLNLEERGP